MPWFIVRKNCEYSIGIEAESADAAMAQAETLESHEWATAWSPMTAELE